MDQVSPVIPDLDPSFQFPEQVLAKKLVSKGVRPVQQVLIKWSGWPDALATWEDLEALRQRFPSAPAWGQVGSLQGGMLPPSTRSTLHRLSLGLAAPLGPGSPACVCQARNGIGPCKGRK